MAPRGPINLARARACRAEELHTTSRVHAITEVAPPASILQDSFSAHGTGPDRDRDTGLLPIQTST